MTPTPPSSPPATSKLAWLWDRRRPLAAGAGVLLAVLCPFAPPPLQGPCVAARAGVQIVQRVLEQLSQPPPPCEPESCTSIAGPRYTVHQADGGDCGCPER